CAEGAGIGFDERGTCPGDDPGVAWPERLAHALGEPPARVGEAAVQVREDPSRILTAAKVDHEEVQLALRRERLDVHPLAVEAQERRTAAEGADLIHPPALGSRAPLASVSDLHLVANREREPVSLAERPGD